MAESLPSLTEPEISLEQSPKLRSDSVADLVAWLRAHRVEEIECHTPDMAGIARGKLMPAAKWMKSQAIRLPISVYFTAITGDYANIAAAESTQLGYLRDADLNLVPDLKTARALPWTDVPSIQIIHDAMDADNKPLPFAPRSVLRRVLQAYDDKGWQPIVAPELEFYLTEPNRDPDLPLEPPVGRSGRTQVSNQAYSMQGVDEYENVITHLYDFAEAQDIEIDTIIQEFGTGQLEVNLLHGDAMAKADEIFLFKRTVREAALRCGAYATFMAKPMRGQPGNAMHIHQSLIDKKSGANLFSDAKGEMSPLFYHFIAGQQAYSYAAACIWAPYVNSYRRLVPDMSAPINAEWGHDNRSVGLRVPRSEPENRRVENRFIGADTNPYLSIAAALAAGYLGMIEAQEPRPPLEGSSFEKGRDLPYSLLEGIAALEQCEPLRQLLGSQFVDIYAAIKYAEYDAFMDVISPWEREHLLLNV